MTLRKGAQTSAVNPRRYLPYHTEVTANCQTLIPPAALCARTLKEHTGQIDPAQRSLVSGGEAAPERSGIMACRGAVLAAADSTFERERGLHRRRGRRSGPGPRPRFPHNDDAPPRSAQFLRRAERTGGERCHWELRWPASEPVLQTEGQSQEFEVAKRELARERGHAVGPHRFVAANDRPHDIFRHVSQTSPVQIEAQRSPFPEGVIHAAQDLKAGDGAIDRAVKQTQRAGRGRTHDGRRSNIGSGTATGGTSTPGTEVPFGLPKELSPTHGRAL